MNRQQNLNQVEKGLYWSNLAKGIAPLLIAVLVAVVLIVGVRESHRKATGASMLSRSEAIFVLDNVRGDCITVYEPTRKSFHACPSVDRRTANIRTVPLGTKPSDVMSNPGEYGLE